MRIGINGSDKLVRPDLDTILDDIATAEKEGLSSYWLAQTGLLDALGTLALAGTRTSSITVGTAVVPTWMRHPHVAASQALTAQAATGGRLTLGIGLLHQPVVEERLGMKWERPIRHLLDYLDILQPLLEGGAVEHQGEVWSFAGAAARPTEIAPKLMIAALGEQTLRIAGRRCDGTILWCVGPLTLERRIVPTINEAAAGAGRPQPSVVCSLPLWVTDNPGPAKEFVGTILRDYASLPSYRAVLDVEGVQGVEEISLIGDEDTVRGGLARLAEAGATDFTAVVMGGNPDETARGRALLGDVAASA